VASQAKLVVTVTATRGASKVTFSSKGKYISLITAGISGDLTKQPIFSTTSAEAFWVQVLPLVQAAIQSLELRAASWSTACGQQ
jgi:hypothetical protein